MDSRSDDELMARANAFTLRARRIGAHSLMADEEALAHLAGGGFLMRRKDGAVSVERRLPNEEVLESLAARVRPLTLQGDPVFYADVLNALNAYLHREGHEKHVAWFKQMKSTFASVDPKSSKATYFLSLTMDGEPPLEMTDAALALAWFYGDLVHADAAHVLAGENFGIDLRFAAAAVRTAQLALLSRDTFSYIRFLVDEGVLPANAVTAEKKEVKVESKNLELTGAYLGAVGTAVSPGQDPIEAGMGQVTAESLGDEDGLWGMRIPWGDDPEA